MKHTSKIWGNDTLLFLNDHIQINQINIKQLGRCSKHYHVNKNNIFLIQDGQLLIEQWSGNIERIDILTKNQSIVVPKLIQHRFTAIENTKAIEIYISDDNLIDINDIIREDYGMIINPEDLKIV